METGSNTMLVSALYTKLLASIPFKHTSACNSTLAELSSALLVPGCMFYYNESFPHVSDVLHLSHTCRTRSPWPWCVRERKSFRNLLTGVTSLYLIH